MLVFRKMKYHKLLFRFIIAFCCGILLNTVPSLSHGADIAQVISSRQISSPVKIGSNIQGEENKIQSIPQVGKDTNIIHNVRIDNYENKYLINSDYTYTCLKTQQTTLLTKQGIEDWKRDYLDYSPDTQSVELIDAYVIQPNGKKIKVTKENIFTRSSPEYVPGFTNDLRMTIVFPQLKVGSKTFVQWKLIQKKPFTVGLSDVETPFFSIPVVKESIEIELPTSLKLHWKKRGNYTVTDTYEGNLRRIKAVITNRPGYNFENGMVSTWDFDSMFVFSNLDSWEEIGQMIWDKWRDKIIITPEIKKLALTITKDKEGIEAARSIYNWIAQNIEYLAVYLNESAGYIPHTSTQILRNGYGDCKDYVLLMHTLLKAIGIKSIPTLVSSGDMYQKLLLPTSSQFNHAIIYLPDYQIFSDPTNNYAALEELDDSVSNKFVILLTEKGLTKYTPKSLAENNRYEMKASINIKKNGTIKGESELKYSGNFNSGYRQYFTSNTPKQIANKILAGTPEGGAGTLKTNELNNLDVPVKVEAKWNSPHAVDVEDQIYFNTPVGINTINSQWLRRYLTLDKRLYPFIVGARSYNWEYKINIPAGYKIIRQPKNRNFLNTTGSYISSYEQKEGYIVVKRNLIINKDVYKAEEYPDFQELIHKPINDARSIIVFEKKSV